MKKYEIRADAKKYSEYEVDENGKMTFEHHEYEGVDLINYKIIDTSEDSESDDSIFESESFEDTKKEFTRLNIKRINHMQEKTIREILVSAIQSYSGDSYESKSDLWGLVIKSEKELLLEVVQLLEYYKNNQN